MQSERRLILVERLVFQLIIHVVISVFCAPICVICVPRLFPLFRFTRENPESLLISVSSIIIKAAP